MNISKNNILNEAKEIKEFVEKNKKLPTYATIEGSRLTPSQYTYVLSKMVSDINLKQVEKINVNEAQNPTGQTINENVYLDDYVDMAKRVVKYVATNKHIPNYCTTKKSKTKVRYELYVYCFAKILTYYLNNKRLPNYCSFKSTDIQANKINTTKTNKTTTTSTSDKQKTTKKSNCTNPYQSSPHYTAQGCGKLGQCTAYYCGPHSIHQAIRKFGITKFDERKIANWCGTTTSGTDHNGINTAIAKISKETGIKLSTQWKYFSDMGSTDAERFDNIAKTLCKPNKAVIWHIAYINGGSSTSGKHFGHYECIDKVNESTKYVRALNSLGNRKSDGSYYGKLQDRKYSVQAYFARNTPGSQKALCIITKG